MSKSIRTLYHAPRSIGEVPYIFQYIHDRMATYFKIPNSPDFQVTIPPGTIAACDELIAAMERYIQCVFNDGILKKGDFKKREKYFTSLTSIRNSIAAFGTVKHIPATKLYMAVSGNSNLRKLARRHKSQEVLACDYEQISNCIRLIWG